MGTGKPVQGFIETIIHSSDLPSKDRQLAVMLVTGVLRRQEYLDLIISRFSSTKLRKMKPLTLAALRVGVLQICLLDRIPVSAAVNETVAALKKMRQPPWLLGFVNATLRNIAKKKDSLPPPEHAGPNGEPTLDHPDWLCTRWTNQLGQEMTQAICQINNQESELCLRANPLYIESSGLINLLSQEGIQARPGQYAPDSLCIENYRGAINNLPGFVEGKFHVQDQAAQLACHLLGPFQKQGRYLDACAGLGGKTCTVASLLPQNASLQAVDPDNRRIQLLKENLEREGLAERTEIFHGTLEEFALSNPGKFTAILVDAPCSGTGVIRKHPDIRWNRKHYDFAEYQAKQLALLHTAAKLLCSGGVLVYATCSIEPEENHEVVEQFLGSATGFITTNCQEFLPKAAAPLVDRHGFFAPLPGPEIEGFFAARLIYQGF